MAIYTIIVDPEASKEIQKVVDWYDSQSSSLGDVFRQQVMNQIDSLKQNPRRYNIRYGKVRCMPTNRFPFRIHFFVEEPEKRVVVFTIRHEKQNPDHWPRA